MLCVNNTDINFKHTDRDKCITEFDNFIKFQNELINIQINKKQFRHQLCCSCKNKISSKKLCLE